MSNDFTVGELRRHLQAYGDDTKLTFAGNLGFYRLKALGKDEAFVEFNEPQGHLSDDFKKSYPNVKVMFIDIDNVGWDKSGVIGGPIDASIR